MKKRKSRKQAVRRSNESLLERLGGSLISCVRWIGTSKGLYLIAVFGAVVALGVMKAMTPPSLAAEMNEHVPDEISEPCWKKIVRQGMRETTVDRAAREEMEAALKIADKCKDKMP